MYYQSWVIIFPLKFNISKMTIYHQSVNLTQIWKKYREKQIPTIAWWVCNYQITASWQDEQLRNSRCEKKVSVRLSTSTKKELLLYSKIRFNAIKWKQNTRTSEKHTLKAHDVIYIDVLIEASENRATSDLTTNH